jgi:adenine-specific DNA methylase
LKASEFSFKKGLYQLNPQPNFNFQLNRVIMWDGGRLEDVQKAGSRITDSQSWKHKLTRMAQEAESDYRTVDKLIRMLTNVRSLTFRLMTEAEQASNHCNCGNSRLVLDTVTDWIFMMKRKR